MGGSTSETQVDVVVDKADKDPPAPAPVHTPEPKPEPKRTITYLTNLKTFLTFIVVAHHCVGQWYNSSAGGIGTLGYDPNESGQPLPSFTIFGAFFQTCNQGYFMATFFLISGLFCPKSLDRKGFRNFVLDKMVRLGGPFLIYSVLLGPAMDLWISAYGGFPLSWKYNMGPPWFILWLLNFSILYAAIAHFLPKMRQFAMPHPLLVVLFGFVLAPCFWALGSVLGDWAFLGGMVFWNFGLFIYIPFFIAGVVGGRNGWLKSVEEIDVGCLGLARHVPCCLGAHILVDCSNRDSDTKLLRDRRVVFYQLHSASVRHCHDLGPHAIVSSILQRHAAEFRGAGCGPGSLHGLRDSFADSQGRRTGPFVFCTGSPCRCFLFVGCQRQLGCAVGWVALGGILFHSHRHQRSGVATRLLYEAAASTKQNVLIIWGI